MNRLVSICAALCLASSAGHGCGLDWTLPQAHFEGVDENGYVAYWEKIGEVDLGDGLVIPVHINFNSHRESSSSVLGKGWMVALLESHVEPVNENCMNVIMPDGWIFTFLRNGSTQTWRGNAGWVGETNNNLLNITAPCGWKIKFDGGKIQEIDSGKNRTLTYRYNAGIVTEVDEGSKTIAQVESDTAGNPIGLIIGGQRVNISLAQRPRIQRMLNQNLISGFAPSLNRLQWPDGREESFSFGATEQDLNSTLKIIHPDQAQRYFTWDPITRQIKTDNDWTYKLTASDTVALDRTNAKGQNEFYYNDIGIGTTTIIGLNGIKQVTTRFTSGILAGNIRKLEEFQPDGKKISIRQDSYNDRGNLIRSKETKNGIEKTIVSLQYDSVGNLLKLTDSSGFTRFYKKDEMGKIVEDTYSPDYQKELIKKEGILLQAIPLATSSEAKDEALQNLALFYIYHSGNIEKAKDLLPKIKDASMHFNILSQSVKQDVRLSISAKAAKYRNLQSIFPEERTTLEREIVIIGK